MSEIDDLKAAVQAVTDAANNEISVVNAVIADLQSKAGDPTAVAEAAASLQTVAANLQAVSDANASLVPPPPPPAQ